MTDIDDLARRLAAHPRWEWRPGLEWHGPSCGGQVRGDELRAHALWHAGGVPDLASSATAGVLLAMLRSSVAPGYDWVAVSAESLAHGWEVLVVQRAHVAEGAHQMANGYGEGATLGEAAARALLAVWGDG